MIANPSRVAALCLLLSACGGASFHRTPGAASYAALPMQVEISIVADPASLPPPTEDLGELSTSSLAEDDRSRVELELRVLARRNGCDVVAGISVTDEPQKSKQLVKKAGKDGKIETVQEDVLTHHWLWHARCIRTAKYGLKPKASAAREQTSPEAVAPPPAPETAQAEPCSEVPQGQRDFCVRMDRFTTGYLRAWHGKLHVGKPEAVDLLQAFAELIAQVSGPGGFWRKTVPQQWFGCASDNTTPQCVRLAAATGDLKQYDHLAEALVAVPPAQAMAYLQHHQQKLVDYLDAYVPDEANLSAAQATAFYKLRLQQ